MKDFAYFTISLVILFGVFYLFLKDKNKNRIPTIEEHHNILRKLLLELKRDYSWAKRSGEKEKEQAIEKHIFEVEDKIEEIVLSHNAAKTDPKQQKNKAQ